MTSVPCKRCGLPVERIVGLRGRQPQQHASCKDAAGRDKRRSRQRRKYAAERLKRHPRPCECGRGCGRIIPATASLKRKFSAACMGDRRRELWAARAEDARVTAANEADSGADLEPGQIEAIAKAALLDVRYRRVLELSGWDGYQVSFE